MTATTHLYALVDPRDGEVRYVGKADNPKRRLKLHIAEAKRVRKNHRHSWILSLADLGLEPQLRVLCEVPASEWQQRERDLIADLKAKGARLTNSALGGDGGYIKESAAATRKQMLVTHPDGTQEVVTGMRKFAREHGLTLSCMWKVTRGLATHHHGYGFRFLDAPPPPEMVRFEATHPTGEREQFWSVKEWAENRGYRAGSIYRVIAGYRPKYRGMMFRRLPQCA